MAAESAVHMSGVCLGILSHLTKRVLEYGVGAPVFYGNLREQTGENGFPRKPIGNLFGSCRDLRNYPETSGSFRDNVI